MRVYADNAATTAMSQVAIDAMLPYFDKIYGNPSSLHSVGQEAKEALDAGPHRPGLDYHGTLFELHFPCRVPPGSPCGHVP